MPRSAPMASAVRIVSCAAGGPSDTMTTSPAPACSLRRRASSTANSSYGLRINLTPASSSDLPSEAILTRVSESGTRFTHTAIFIGAENKPGDWLLATACGCGFLEVDTHADLHVTRRPRREPALHRRGGRG